MDTWALALLIVAAVLVTFYLMFKILQVWAVGAYQNILQNPSTDCDIDAFVGPQNPVSALKVVLAQKIQIGSRQASSDAIPLEVTRSPHVEGLRVSRKLSGNSSEAVSVDQLLQESDKKQPIVIATIRMGFGHHRLAYSAASWALQTGHTTIFHDLLSIEGGTCSCFPLFGRGSCEMIVCGWLLPFFFQFYLY